MLFTFTHKQLIPVAYKWLIKVMRCGVAFKELNSACCNGEYPDAIGFTMGGHSVLVEVKVSRSDFLNDKKKSFRKNPALGMGTNRYYMCPEGLIQTKDLPPGWGLIWVNQKGKYKTVFDPITEYPYEAPGGNKYVYKRPFIFEKNIKAEHELMYSALRRLHIKGHIESIYDKDYNYGFKDTFETPPAPEKINTLFDNNETTNN